MDTCPHCHRRLLSHISIRCNWCGTEINDPAYLAQAEVERATSRAEDALHSLQSLTISQVTDRYASRFDQASALFGLPPRSRQEDAATQAGRIKFEALEGARRETLLRAQQLKAAEEASAEEPAAEAHDRFGHLEYRP